MRDPEQSAYASSNIASFGLSAGTPNCFDAASIAGPNAEHVKILRALVKETMSREQVERLTRDMHEACNTLDKKGGAHEAERQQVKQGTGY